MTPVGDGEESEAEQGAADIATDKIKVRWDLILFADTTYSLLPFTFSVSVSTFLALPSSLFVMQNNRLSSLGLTSGDGNGESHSHI